MKLVASLLALAMCAMLGCGGSGSDGGNAGVPNLPSQPPAAAPSSLSFTAFSKSIAAREENGDPSEVESVTFMFDGDDDPAAYDELLPPES